MADYTDRISSSARSRAAASGSALHSCHQVQLPPMLKKVHIASLYAHLVHAMIAKLRQAQKKSPPNTMPAHLMTWLSRQYTCAGLPLILGFRVEPYTLTPLPISGHRLTPRWWLFLSVSAKLAPCRHAHAWVSYQHSSLGHRWLPQLPCCCTPWPGEAASRPIQGAGGATPTCASSWPCSPWEPCTPEAALQLTCRCSHGHVSSPGSESADKRHRNEGRLSNGRSCCCWASDGADAPLGSPGKAAAVQQLGRSTACHAGPVSLPV